VAAQQAADRMLDEARGEADKIVSEARTEAENFASARDAKKAEVDAEMSQMTELVAGVRNKLAVLATTVADKLDEMDAAVAGAQGQGAADPEAISDSADEDAYEGGDDGLGLDDDGEDHVTDEGTSEEGDGEVLEDTGDDTGLEVDTDDSSDEPEEEGAGTAEIEGLQDADRDGEDQGA
jgi:hypothetical protein